MTTSPITASGSETRSGVPVAFFSSGSGNTANFAARLSVPSVRIPARQSEPGVVMTEPFVLITPNFADGAGKGAVPAPVVRFLNDPRNRALLQGVVGAGNRNFGEMFALGGDARYDVRVYPTSNGLWQVEARAPQNKRERKLRDRCERGGHVRALVAQIEDAEPA